MEETETTTQSKRDSIASLHRNPTSTDDNEDSRTILLSSSALILSSSSSQRNVNEKIISHLSETRPSSAATLIEEVDDGAGEYIEKPVLSIVHHTSFKSDKGKSSTSPQNLSDRADGFNSTGGEMHSHTIASHQTRRTEHSLDPVLSSKTSDNRMSNNVDEVVVDGAVGDTVDGTTLDEVEEVFISFDAVLACMIIIGSIIGNAIRVGITDAIPNSSTPYLLPQFIGSMILGYVYANKAAIDSIYAPLYVCIATGMCGSITTFSTWQVDAVKLIGYDAQVIGTTQRVITWFETQIVGICVPLVGLEFGVHLSFVKCWSAQREKRKTKVIGIPCCYLCCQRGTVDTKKFLGYQLSMKDQLTIALTIGISLIVILITIFYPTSLNLSEVFAPFGSLLRWRLAVRLNAINPNFPVGTFVANILGTCILGMLVVLETNYNGTDIQCAIISALGNGFCGCLTTISTFVYELRVLINSRKDAYVYGFTSVIISQILLFIIMGGYIWSIPNSSLPNPSCVSP